MKFFTIISSLLIALGVSARDPGTGSNTTVGPGPATPDAGAGDTSIMGGGTPGNLGINNMGFETERARRVNKEAQEAREEEKKKDRPRAQDNTDQNPDLNKDL